VRTVGESRDTLGVQNIEDGPNTLTGPRGSPLGGTRAPVPTNQEFAKICANSRKKL